VAPPGNQAANRENKLQPIVSEETGLLDSLITLSGKILKREIREKYWSGRDRRV